MTRNYLKYKPKEIIYHGQKYRSQLEVRWAIFFDAIGLQYDYEKIVLKDKNGTIEYIPDFYINTIPCFIEVKPTKPQKKEFEKAYKLSVAYNIPTYIFCGNLPQNIIEIGKDFLIYKDNQLVYQFFGLCNNEIIIQPITEILENKKFCKQINTILLLARNLVINI